MKNYNYYYYCYYCSATTVMSTLTAPDVATLNQFKYTKGNQWIIVENTEYMWAKMCVFVRTELMIRAIGRSQIYIQCILYMLYAYYVLGFKKSSFMFTRSKAASVWSLKFFFVTPLLSLCDSVHYSSHVQAMNHLNLYN